MEDLVFATDTLKSLWLSFLKYIPKLVFGIIIFCFGWFISAWLEKLISQILKKINFDSLFKNWKEIFEKAEIKGEISDFIAGLIKWVLIITFLVASINVLGLSELSQFLDRIVSWLPNLVVAMAIFIIAAIFVNYVEKIVSAVINKLGFSFGKFVAKASTVAIWTFALLAILSQLGVAKDLVKILFAGIVALIVISCGLAFGLGGQSLAKEILEEIRKRLK